MRYTHATTAPCTSKKLCVLVLSCLTVTRAQDQLTSITSTFLSLPMLSLPSVLPPPPLVIPNSPSNVLIPQRPTTNNGQPPPVKTLAASAPSTPIPMAAWEVLPEGVPRTSSGKPIPCSPKNTKLNPTTHKLISECVETMFCAAPPGSPVNATGLGVCFPRVCRRDEFPFGYTIPDIGTSRRARKKATNITTAALPVMCAPGQYCPDDGSGCRSQVGIGGACELDRDDQCQSPPLEQGINQADNKAVCLNKVCMAATLLLGAPCVIENTTYVGDINRGAAGGGQFTTVVIKHNCLAPGLFCDPTPPNVDAVGSICQPSKKLGETCRFDVECELGNCSTPGNKCILPAETSMKIESWHWAATILFIVASMTIAILVLLFIQRRRQFRHYQHLQAYFYEQISLRRSILALHAAAIEQQALNKAVAEKATESEQVT